MKAFFLKIKIKKKRIFKKWWGVANPLFLTGVVILSDGSLEFFFMASFLVRPTTDIF